MEEIKCKEYGGIKAILIQPMSLFPQNYTDEQYIANSEPFLQVGDVMTNEGDSVYFGKDTIYIKLSND
jgi:hypothetical protein